MFDIMGKYKPNDKNLNSISIRDNKGNELFLTKLSNDNKHLYRSIHKGKLSLYDKNYSFSFQPVDVHITDMMIKDGSHLKPLSFWPVNAKRTLVNRMNEVYGTHLDAKNYTKRELLEYLTKLD